MAEGRGVWCVGWVACWCYICVCNGGGDGRGGGGGQTVLSSLLPRPCPPTLCVCASANAHCICLTPPFLARTTTCVYALLPGKLHLLPTPPASPPPHTHTQPRTLPWCGALLRSWRVWWLLQQHSSTPRHPAGWSGWRQPATHRWVCGVGGGGVSWGACRGGFVHSTVSRYHRVQPALFERTCLPPSMGPCVVVIRAHFTHSLAPPFIFLTPSLSQKTLPPC